MSLFSLEEARILADGRILKTVFVARPAPAQHGYSDWMPGWSDGLRLTLSNGAECEPLGVMSVDYTRFQIDAVPVTNASSTIPAGTYFFRFAIANSEGTDVHVYDLTGQWASHDMPVAVAAGRSVTFNWYEAIPPGHVGRIYGSKIDGALIGAADDLGLLVDNIPPGTQTYSLTNYTFANVNRAPDYPRTWVVHWLLPTERTAIFNDSTLTLTAPAGLIRDEFGNQTAGATAFPIVNLSMVEGDGWSTERFTLTENGVERYVSSTYGNDANPGTLTQPKQTLSAAWNSLPARSGSVVRLLRGDTFTQTASLGGRWGVDGQRTSPLRLEDYWYDYSGSGTDPGTRPLIMCGSSDFISWHTGYTTAFSNIVLRRIKLVATVYGKGRVYWLQKSENVFISDCVFENCGVIVECVAGFSAYNITVHRCITCDNRNPTAHNQGMFIQGVHNMLVSQCVFERNGWKNDTFTTRTSFDHNIYGQHRATEFILWGSWLSRGGNYGAQLRGGGTIAYCVFNRNQVGSGFVRNCGSTHRSVYVNSEVVGWAANVGQAVIQSNCVHSTIEFCIVAHSTVAAGFGIGIRTSDAWVEGEARRLRRYSVARHSTAWNHALSIQAGNGQNDGTSLQKCICVNKTQNVDAMLVVVSTGPANLDWFHSNQNAWYVTRAQPFKVQMATTTAYSLTDWRLNFGDDLNSVSLAPSLVQEGYNLQDFSQQQGGPATEAEFLDLLRTRPRRTWSAIHDAQAAYAAFSAAFMPTNLGAVGSDAFGFIGPVDYRSAVPVTFELVGPSRGLASGVLTFTVNASGVVSAQVDVSDGGAGGTIAPASLVWSNDANPRSFTYTALRQGVVQLGLSKLGNTVASSAIIVRNTRLEQQRRRMLEGVGSPF